MAKFMTREVAPRRATGAQLAQIGMQIYQLKQQAAQRKAALAAQLEQARERTKQITAAGKEKARQATAKQAAAQEKAKRDEETLAASQRRQEEYLKIAQENLSFRKSEAQRKTKELAETRKARELAEQQANKALADAVSAGPGAAMGRVGSGAGPRPSTDVVTPEYPSIPPRPTEEGAGWPAWPSAATGEYEGEPGAGEIPPPSGAPAPQIQPQPPLAEPEAAEEGPMVQVQQMRTQIDSYYGPRLEQARNRESALKNQVQRGGLDKEGRARIASLIVAERRAIASIESNRARDLRSLGWREQSAMREQKKIDEEATAAGLAAEIEGIASQPGMTIAQFDVESARLTAQFPASQRQMAQSAKSGALSRLRGRQSEQAREDKEETERARDETYAEFTSKHPDAFINPTREGYTAILSEIAQSRELASDTAVKDFRDRAKEALAAVEDASEAARLSRTETRARRNEIMTGVNARTEAATRPSILISPWIFGAMPGKTEWKIEEKKEYAERLSKQRANALTTALELLVESAVKLSMKPPPAVPLTLKQFIQGDPKQGIRSIATNLEKMMTDRWDYQMFYATSWGQERWVKGGKVLKPTKAWQRQALNEGRKAQGKDRSERFEFIDDEDFKFYRQALHKLAPKIKGAMWTVPNLRSVATRLFKLMKAEARAPTLAP